MPEKEAPLSPVDGLLRSFAIHNRIHLYLLDAHPAEAWQGVPPGGKGRTLAAMVAMAFHLISRRTAETAHLARRRAEAASEAKTRLLAMVSHDLRNPLSPIRMAVALAEQDPIVAERAGEHLKLIRECVAMQGRLIDDLMDVARLATGRFKISPAEVDVHAILARALQASETAANEKRIVVESKLNAGRSTVMGDAFRIQQVFWNLLQNAIRFTPPGGNICVRSFQTPDDWIVVEVQDNGTGIEPMHLPLIFKAFEQVTEASVRNGGLGLGLTICRGIIDAHDGAISASSAGVGKGASFVVRLPLVGNAKGSAAISSPAALLSHASRH